RGYVQLTWKSNYKRFGKLLNVDLVNDPDRAKEPEIAYQIAVTGMFQGMFTGKKFSNYVIQPDGKKTKAATLDYRNCRRIINGLDKADKIKEYAIIFEYLIRRSIKKVLTQK